MEVNEMQQAFFHHIKSRLPAHLSLVDEVADLLSISNDSAYRRIRGEKAISFEEIAKLAAHFKISVDQLLKLKSEGGTFTGKYVKEENFDFGNFLEQMLHTIKFIASFRQKEVTYFSKDFPVFHYFPFPELSAFKYFCWMKTMLQFPQFARADFSSELLLQPLIDVGQKVTQTYCTIPGIEIMHVDNMNTTLRQIEYYRDMYLFRSAEELVIIFNQLHEMTDHLERQAEAGVKFLPSQKPNSQCVSFHLYVNDFLIGDNSICITTDGIKTSILLHSYLNLITITDEEFTDYHHGFVKNIIKKSILISEVGEKYRSRFFHILHDRIEQCREGKMQAIGKL